MNRINANANSRSFNAFASKLLLQSVIHFHLSKQLFAPTYLVIDRPFVFVCVCLMSNLLDDVYWRLYKEFDKWPLFRI